MNTGISFIIPALNEEAHIGTVLDSVKKSVGDVFIFEILVVDNGSDDRTVEIASAREARCLIAPGCSISALRNLGAEKAQFDLLVFLDADVYLEEDWGQRLKTKLRLDALSGVISGSTYGVSKDHSWIERVWFSPLVPRKETKYINGGHLVVHRDLFSCIGGFDPGLETGEDCDFCNRARKMGVGIVNDPELKTVHMGYPKTVKSFFVRERWHALGDYRSVATLAASKPALVSIANMTVAVGCVLGAVAFQSILILILYPAFLLAVSFAASATRFRLKVELGFIFTIFLHMVYITARTVALGDIMARFLLSGRRGDALRS